jgi:hypothetical protein
VGEGEGMYDMYGNGTFLGGAKKKRKTKTKSKSKSKSKNCPKGSRKKCVKTPKKKGGAMLSFEDLQHLM